MDSQPTAYELEGKIKVIEDLKTFPSGFTKREFVVTTEERFPQDIKLECVKERVDMLSDVNPGDRVKVSFNLRGNEYNGKYYVNLQAWRLSKAEGGADEPPMDGPMDGAMPDDTEDSPF